RKRKRTSTGHHPKIPLTTLSCSSRIRMSVHSRPSNRERFTLPGKIARGAVGSERRCTPKGPQRLITRAIGQKGASERRSKAVEVTGKAPRPLDRPSRTIFLSKQREGILRGNTSNEETGSIARRLARPGARGAVDGRCEHRHHGQSES